MFFRFPADARWNADRAAVECGIGGGEYEGVVRIPGCFFQRLLDKSSTPERCLEAYYLQRTRLERIAERKVRRRQLTDDANVEITGRDLREREQRAPAGQIAFEGRRHRVARSRADCRTRGATGHLPRCRTRDCTRHSPV